MPPFEGDVVDLKAALAYKAPFKIRGNYGENMETPGLMLKREREARGLTLVELAKVTRISASALENIENDAFDEFPAEVFVRGFLRNYARQLSIPSEEIMASYETWKAQRTPRIVEPEPVAETRTETPESQESVRPHAFRFAYVAILLIAVACVGLSLAFMRTGVAEEGDADYLVQPSDGIESPFLISNTSEGWIAE